MGSQEKKKEYKTTSTTTSAKRLMFKGSGKCPTVDDERVDKSVKEHCSSHVSNRDDSKASDRAWPKPGPMQEVMER